MILLRAVVLVALVLASPGRADVPQSSACSRMKLRAVANQLRHVGACELRAARRGEFANLACLARAQAGLEQAFTRADAGAGCAVPTDPAEHGERMEQVGTGLARSVLFVAIPSRCNTTWLKGLSRLLIDLLRIRGRDRIAPDAARLDAALASAETRYAAAKAAGIAAGDCLNPADLPDYVRNVFEPLIEQELSRLLPVCGNDLLEPTEECDGVYQSACPGNCQADCTCPPICGDAKINLPWEECDRTALGGCQACRYDCTCNTATSCGNGIVDGSEQCDAALGPCFIDTECVGAGLPGECTCCSTGLCSIFFGGCCPGLTCVATGGPGGEGDCAPVAACSGLHQVCGLYGLPCCAGFACAPPNGLPTHPYTFCCLPLSATGCSRDVDCCIGICSGGSCVP
jgi:hypothetical protein